MSSTPLDTLPNEEDDDLGSRIARLEATVEAVIRSLSSLERSVEGLRSDMQSLEQRVHQSLDASEQRFRTEIAALRHELAGLRQDLRQEMALYLAPLRAEFQSRFAGLELQISVQEGRMDRIEARLDRLEAKIDRLDAKLDSVAASLRAEMQALRTDMRWGMGLLVTNTLAVFALLLRQGGLF